MLSPSAVDKHLSHMAEAKYIAVDTETTGIVGIKDGRAWLTGISVAYRLGDFGVVSAYFPFRHADGSMGAETLSRLRLVLEEKPLIFHNLKFDLHSLYTIGIHPRGRLFDTLNIAHLVNENWPSKQLNWLSKTLLNDEKIDKVAEFAKIFGWADIPGELMGPYACKDAELTFRLFEVLWPMLKEQSLEGLWPIESSYCQLLTKIERHGALIDRMFCAQKASDGYSRMDAIEQQLGWRPSSSIDLSMFLLDKLKYPVHHNTPGGKPSFDKDAMEFYDELLENDGRSEAYLVAEFRGWQKAVSSLYESALEYCSPDGRLRANFKQHGTRTGRLSCETPNLQQIPRESKHVWNGDAKRFIIAPEGHKLIEFDYAQLEFRLATAYGRDQVLLDSFERGDDVFIPIANEVFGGPEFRQHAKTTTYSTLYGAGLVRLMSALGLDEANATGVRERFRSSYPGIYEKSRIASDNIRVKGFVKYWTGRKRHLPKDQAHKAFNSVIQGGAAELVKRSMLLVDEQVCNDNIRMILTVHDSIVLEIREDLVEEVIPQVIKLMTDWPQFGVTLAVDAHEWGVKE